MVDVLLDPWPWALASSDWIWGTCLATSSVLGMAIGVKNSSCQRKRKHTSNLHGINRGLLIVVGIDVVVAFLWDIVRRSSTRLHSVCTRVGEGGTVLATIVEILELWFFMTVLLT